jgi:Glycosyl hydrolases family 39
MKNSVSFKCDFRKLILAGLILAIVSSTGWSGQLLIPPQIPVPKEYFGLHIHRALTTTKWPEIEFGSWRLLDAYVSWVNLQSSQTKWDFRKLDAITHLSQQKNIDLLMPLAFTPQWAAAKPTEKGPYGPGSASPPKDLADWKNYISKIAIRYNKTILGNINTFEIWNEVNERGFFTGTQEEMLALSKEAYSVIKEVNTANRLVSPSGVGWKGISWLESYLEKGGSKYADIISFHFYVPSDAPEAMVSNIQKVQKIMLRLGIQNKPLWNTEMGWWIAYEDGTKESASSVNSDWLKLTPKQGAAFVSRALILGWAAGLERFYWYAWDSKNMGLIEPTNHKLKFSGQAFGTTVQWMMGATVKQCAELKGSVWECILLRNNTEHARIVWTTGIEQDYKLPADWKIPSIKLHFLNGEFKNITNSKIKVSEMPILLSRYD